MEEQESRGYWKNVLTILDDYDQDYKKEPLTLDTIKSINLRPSLVKRQRTMVLDEYMRLKAIDTKKVDPPPYLGGERLRREKTLVEDPWRCGDQAVRQLANVTRKSPRQRYFPGFGDSRLQNARSCFGLPLRPLQREVTRLPTDVSPTESWPGKPVLPKIENERRELKESENTADSPIPVTSLDRGITLLYDVNGTNARTDDDAPEGGIERERTFITNGSETDILVVEGEASTASCSDDEPPRDAEGELQVETESLSTEMETGNEENV